MSSVFPYTTALPRFPAAANCKGVFEVVVLCGGRGVIVYVRQQETTALIDVNKCNQHLKAPTGI